MEKEEWLNEAPHPGPLPILLRRLRKRRRGRNAPSVLRGQHISIEAIFRYALNAAHTLGLPRNWIIRAPKVSRLFHAKRRLLFRSLSKD